MVKNYCPECGGELFYDASVRRYICRSCGLYVTKDEILELREKIKLAEESEKKKKKERGEYLEWWLSKKS